MNRFKFEDHIESGKPMINNAAADPRALGNLLKKRVVDVTGAFLRRDIV
jgi:hypothetical protein